MIEQEKLKPCPFCGSENTELFRSHGEESNHPHWFVWCKECGNSGHNSFTKKSARAYWNQRPNLETIKALEEKIVVLSEALGAVTIEFEKYMMAIPSKGDIQLLQKCVAALDFQNTQAEKK